MSSALNVWMNGQHVGRWAVDRGVHAFTYARSWLEAEQVRSLSLSLPISASREIRGQVVANYFDNLLPDNVRIRQRIARRFGARSSDAFALLEAIGRDCAGAVQLLPEDATPDGWNRIRADPLTAAQVESILLAVPSDAPMNATEDDDLFRISLAGAQEKTALLRIGTRWHLPHDATPTTHILKLPLGLVGGSRRVDLSDSVQNEWLCAQILRELGLPVAETTIATFGDQQALVSERFDREWMDRGRWIARLPQEDFCQALGVPPDRKYEYDGGPGMDRCLQLIAGAEDAENDRSFFLLSQLAFWLMAATDGHAKNFSIFLLRGDAYAITPLYDVLSMWPYIGEGPNQFRWRKAGLAMAVRSKNKHYLFETIHARHWHGLAMKGGGSKLWAAMCGLVAGTASALDAVEKRLPKRFPERTWRAISKGMRTQVKRFEAGTGA